MKHTLNITDANKLQKNLLKKSRQEARKALTDFRILKEQRKYNLNNYTKVIREKKLVDYLERTKKKGIKITKQNLVDYAKKLRQEHAVKLRLGKNTKHAMDLYEKTRYSKEGQANARKRLE